MADVVPSSLLFEDFLLGADPVLFVLAGFTTTRFIQLIGRFLVVSCDGTVSGIILTLPGELFGTTTIVGFGCV
jgi:hypothetical protein